MIRLLRPSHQHLTGLMATHEQTIRRLESKLRRLIKAANTHKCAVQPCAICLALKAIGGKRGAPKGPTGRHKTRLALTQSVLAAIMAGASPKRVAADEGVTPATVYRIVAMYGGAIALRKRKA